jgi:hypothetical protein
MKRKKEERKRLGPERGEKAFPLFCDFHEGARMPALDFFTAQFVGVTVSRLPDRPKGLRPWCRVAYSSLSSWHFEDAPIIMAEKEIRSPRGKAELFLEGRTPFSPAERSGFH